MFVVTHLDALLVGLGGGLVLVLVELVTGGIESTGGAAGEGTVTDVALGLLLVGFLGGFGGVALDGFRDVVGSILDRVGGLAENAFVGVVHVGSRHFEEGE